MSVPEYLASKAEHDQTNDAKLWLIEAGSSGFHAGFRDEDGSFWVVDRTDTWPSHPVLFKLQDERPS